MFKKITNILSAGIMTAGTLTVVVLLTGIMTSVMFTACGKTDTEPESSSEAEISVITEAPTEAPTTALTTEELTEAPTEAVTTEALTEPEPATFDDYSDNTYVEYHFRTKKQLDQHFEKHGGEFGEEFGYETASDYEKGACDVINNPDALSKTEKEDGDFVYYIVDSNEFVILSTDGYIRTYFRPSAGLKYYERQ